MRFESQFYQISIIMINLILFVNDKDIKLLNKVYSFFYLFNSVQES